MSVLLPFEPCVTQPAAVDNSAELFHKVTGSCVILTILELAVLLSSVDSPLPSERANCASTFIVCIVTSTLSSSGPAYRRVRVSADMRVCGHAGVACEWVCVCKGLAMCIDNAGNNIYTQPNTEFTCTRAPSTLFVR